MRRRKGTVVAGIVAAVAAAVAAAARTRQGQRHVADDTVARMRQSMMEDGAELDSANSDVGKSCL